MLAPIEEIFCEVDDFCNRYLVEFSKYCLPSTKKRNRKFGLCLSEIMTLMILFHMSQYITLKDFYAKCALHYLKSYFPSLGRVLKVARS